MNRITKAFKMIAQEQSDKENVQELHSKINIRRKIR